MSTAHPQNQRSARPKAPRRVIVVDDHPLMCRAVRAMLAGHDDLEVSGEACDAPSAIHLISNTHPDAAVIDLTLREGHGLELIKQLKSMTPNLRILVYSGHDETIYAERVIAAGANGFLHKSAPAQEVVHAVRAVLDGHVYLSADVKTHLLNQRAREGGDSGSPLKSLSDRELQVFTELGRGANTHQIAERMNVSTKTVDVYRQRIKSKLDISENNELVRRAVEATLSGELI
jgi:DNA-binding NarL/FixJ family response regulator